MFIDIFLVRSQVSGVRSQEKRKRKESTDAEHIKCGGGEDGAGEA
jgi:hypothetical protein